MMICELWFPSPICIDYLNTIDNNQIKNFCLDLKQNSSGRNLSNRGGWQSYDLPVDTPELQSLILEVERSFNSVKQTIGMKDELYLKIDNIWININNKGDYNIPHLHPYSIFSGIYYVEGNPETSGNIVFRNPTANHEYHIEPIHFKHENNLIGNMTCSYKPEPRKLIIFPSWLYHHVEPSNDNDTRISIAFNTKMYSHA
jgi:uncharacterized protein (TIGR02466 family)